MLVLLLELIALGLVIVVGGDEVYQLVVSGSAPKFCPNKKGTLGLNN